MSTAATPEHEHEPLGLWDTLKLLFASSRAFAVVNFVNFGDGIAYFGILTLLTRYLGADLGMTDAATGIAVSVFTGLVTLTMFGGGFVSDTLGVRRALTVSLGIMVLGRVLLTLCPEFGAGGAWAVWPALVLMAVGSGVIQPALYAGVKEFTDPRTATMGYGLLYAIMNLGIVAENFLSPFLRTRDEFVGGVHGLGLGIQGVFAVCTGITLLLLLVNLLFFTRRVEQRDRQRAVADPGGSAAARDRLHFVKDPRFLFFLFILLPVRTLFAHQWLTLPDYVFRCYPEEVASKFEWISGLNPLIIVIFVPLVAALTRRARVVDMMLIGTAVSALTTFILVPGPDLNRLLLYVILFSIGEALWSSRFLEYVADLAPAGQVGAYMGLAGIPWFLAKFTTGLYSGVMLERFIPEGGPADSGTLWLVYALFAMITPIGLLLGRRWLLQAEQR